MTIEKQPKQNEYKKLIENNSIDSLVSAILFYNENKVEIWKRENKVS